MLTRNDFECIGYWIPLAVWFANQPDSTSDKEAETILRVRLNDGSDWDEQWVPPAVGYRKLRQDWRKHLVAQTSIGKKRFRTWCERNLTGQDGPLLYRYEKSERYGFGPPVRVNRPEAVLANVGLALLTAEPKARVAQCKCKKFFGILSPVGRPPIFCPACRAAKLRPSDLSTPRVQKSRKESK